MRNIIDGFTQPLYWILDDAGDVIPAADAVTWALWMGNTPFRQIALDFPGGCKVSTIFTGLVTDLFGAEPMVFETMAFAPDGAALAQYRHSTTDLALSGHERTLRGIQSLQAKSKEVTTASIDALVNPSGVDAFVRMIEAHVENVVPGVFMQLIYTATEKFVQVGDVVDLGDGRTGIVAGFPPPHNNPDIDGKVTIKAAAADLHGRDVAVSAIGAKWIDRGYR